MTEIIIAVLVGAAGIGFSLNTYLNRRKRYNPANDERYPVFYSDEYAAAFKGTKSQTTA